MSDLWKRYISNECSESHRHLSEPATDMLFIDVNNSDQIMQIASYVKKRTHASFHSWSRDLQHLLSKIVYDCFQIQINNILYSCYTLLLNYTKLPSEALEWLFKLANVPRNLHSALFRIFTQF